MKTKLSLYADNPSSGHAHIDYTLTYDRGDYFVCGEFVKKFLGLDEDTPPPPFLNFTYTDKNPKQKGFKKIAFGKHEHLSATREVYISGKFWKATDFFPTLNNKLNQIVPFNVWVKIEIVA